MTEHNITAAELEKLLAEVTPGEWAVGAWSRKMTIKGNIHQVLVNGEYPSAFVPAWDKPEPGEVDGTDEAIANARLIAMAPTIARKVIAAEKLVEALNQSMTAINDWLHIYAGEFCNESDVEETHRRTGEFGTLSYIAQVQSVNTAALAAWEAAQ